MASRSTKQPHVRFASGLTVPPAHRQRKSHSFYPKVAQEKGHSERKSSFDLFWQWGKLSSIPHNQNKRQYSQPKRLAAEDLELFSGKETAALAFPGDFTARAGRKLLFRLWF